jgi:hypothetical protein
VNKSKVHRKDAKVQRNRKVNTLFAKALFASPLPLCASAVGFKAFCHKLSNIRPLINALICMADLSALPLVDA